MIKRNCNMTFSVMWCYENQHCCHVISTASPKAHCFSLCKENWNKVWNESLVMWCCWHWCTHHMTVMSLSMTPFCLIDKDNLNKLQHNLFGHVMLSSIATWHLLAQGDQNEMQHDYFSLLTLVGCTLALCDANGTIVFIRLRQLIQCATKGHMMVVLVSYNADSVINGIY